jgi:Flp pilus assembly protein TadD
MILLLLLSLALGDDAAVAGAAYREAQDALRLGRCEDAVAKLQEALRAEPKETEKLLYRDREGRHREAYYPHSGKPRPISN